MPVIAVKIGENNVVAELIKNSSHEEANDVEANYVEAADNSQMGKRVIIFALHLLHTFFSIIINFVAYF